MSGAEDDPRGTAYLTSTEGWAVHPQGAWALWRFCHRLVSEGYVKGTRKEELLERAANTRDGRGFRSAAELEAIAAKTKTEEEELLL